MTATDAEGRCTICLAPTHSTAEHEPFDQPSGASPARDGDTRLAEIAARAAATTPGPWRTSAGRGSVFVWGGHNRSDHVTNIDNDERGRADAEFVAAAREDVPWLLARLAEVAARHQPYPLDDRTLCRHCGREWPCADAVTAGETE